MMKRQLLWTRVGLGLTLALLLSVATFISGTVAAAPMPKGARAVGESAFMMAPAGTVGLEYVTGTGTPDTRGGIYTDDTYVWIADHKDGLWRANKCDGSGAGQTTGGDKALWDIWHSGDYIYGASGDKKLFVYNDSTGAVVGSIATQGVAYGVYVSGNYAYIASDAGLEVYNVGTPSSPSYVRKVETGLDFVKVRGAGNYLYATAYSDDTLRIFDIFADPSNPIWVGTYNPATSPGGFTGNIRGLYVDAPNGLVYFVNDQADLYIVDVSIPSSPSTEGYLFLPQIGANNFPAGGVHVHRDFAYLTTADGNDDGYLYWVDVSDATNPSEIASYYDAARGLNEPYAEDCWIHVAAHDGWTVYKMSGFQPDNQIKNDGEPGYIGDDIYNADGSGQSKSQEVYPNVTATYQIKVENDADRNDGFTLGHVSPGPVPSGWAVHYFDGAIEVTAQVMAGTYSTGDLSAGGSKVITLEVTPDGTVACDAYMDVKVRAVSTACSDGCAEGSEDVVVARTTLRCPEPEIAVSKTITSGDPAYMGQEISYTIRVTNTGLTTITVLPLQDVYSTTYLTYGYTDTTVFPPVGTWADADSDDHNNDGVVDWSDLTLTEGDLAPGASISVIVTFTAKADTHNVGLPNDETENIALVHDGFADPDGIGGPLPAEPDALPTQQESEEVKITFPTGVMLASFGGVAQPGGVLLGWQTANEVEMVGFNVLRSEADGEWVLLNEEFIFAQYGGAAQGAAYAYRDEAVAPGTRYAYLLEVVKSDGGVEQYPLAAVTAQWWNWLPVIGR